MTVEEFAKDYFETVLQPDELLTEIQVPNSPPHTGTAYDKFVLIEGDMAILGAAVSITIGSKNGTCSNSRIALSAAASIPLRAKQAEKVLVGREIKDKLLEEASRVA